MPASRGRSFLSFFQKQLHEAFRRGSRRRQRRLPLTFERLESRTAPAVFTVLNTSDTGTGSFRQAILDSNANTAAANVIQFNIAGSGIKTISLHSALPALTQAVTIEGDTQPGFNNSPLIGLDGTSAGTGVGGLDITAANCTVRWLIVENYSGDGITITSANNLLADDVVSGNQGNGITITGTGANANTVQASLIGTNVAGTAALANQKDGIDVENGSHNLIGTNSIFASWTLGNIISGNAGDGVAIDGTSANANQVSGNRIGANAAGTGAIANGTTQDPLSGDYGSGVKVTDAVSTFIGGDLQAGSNNIISGNKGSGITITGKATSTTIGGNYIGVDYTGARALANGDAGISLDGASHNQVGGAKSLGLANIISGNTGAGIDLKNAANNNTIQGNFIGTDPTGMVAVGNGADGIGITDSSSNQIGGAGYIAFGNLISGNKQGGVSIENNSNSNQVQGNYIGTNIGGTAALGNMQDGVGIEGDSSNGATGFQPINQPKANLIGGGGTNLLGLGAPTLGVVSALGNLISGNLQGGVSIDDAAGNYVYGNDIGTDATGTMALGNAAEGVSVGAISSANIIGASRLGGFGNLISGNLGGGITIDSGATLNVVSGDFIGTNAAGNAALGNGARQDPLTGDYGDGIGIDGAFNNTIGGNSLDVGNLVSGNAGKGISIGRDPKEMLQLGIPQFGPAMNNTVIGNYIGTDATGTTALGNGWQLSVDANGLGNFGDGVSIEGGFNNTIGGSSNAGLGNLISGNFGNGIGIGADQGALGIRQGYNDPSANNSVFGNRIGTNAAGTAGVGNGWAQDSLGGYSHGIAIEYGAFNNQIGGAIGTGLGNQISGNAGNGVALEKGAQLNRVQGNFIGTDPTGSFEVGNGTAIIGQPGPGSGVSIEGAFLNLIGGDGCQGMGNLISGNAGDGVDIGTDRNNPQQYGPAAGNVVQGNQIGTDVTGTYAIANGWMPNAQGQLGDGVHIENGANNNLIGPGVVTWWAAAMAGFMGGGAWWGVVVFTVGSGNSIACQGNLISGNAADGVHIEAGDAPGALAPAFNAVVGNFIGTDITGRQALPNGENGVHIENGANNNLIGRAGLGNLISGNTDAGVLIETGNADGAVAPAANAVIGNFIGTDLTGTARIPNENGVRIVGAPGNLVAFNLISANTDDGVFIGGAAAGRNLVVANMIGTDISGLNNLGNGQDGIDVQSGNGIGIGVGIGDIWFGFPGIVGNAIRAILLRGGNIIAFNGRLAVSVDPSYQITIENNSMYDNGAGGIALLDGSNNDQPAPELTSVDTVQETGLYASTYYDYHIKGTMFGTANSYYTIQFFSSAGSDGEGDTLLGEIGAYTDSTGEAQIDTLVTALPNGEGSITATATDSQGNTSEFSSAVGGEPPPDSIKTPTTLGVWSSSPTTTVGDAVTFYADTAPG